jgi:hypothetical protein
MSKTGIPMKTIARNIVALLALAGIVSFAPSHSHAADLALEGTGSYSLGDTYRYYSKGKKQGGRYRNLGSDYYQSARIRMDRVTNYSGYRSGSMSFELWATDYYDATSGIVVMTTGLNRLNQYRYYNKVNRGGFGLYLDDYYYPQLNLFEYAGGWQWRDVLVFEYDDWF